MRELLERILRDVLLNGIWRLINQSVYGVVGRARLKAQWRREQRRLRRVGLTTRRHHEEARRR